MYRLFEIIPAILSWGTLAILTAACFFVPAWVAIFIILFDFFWFLKTLYYTLHLRVSFSKMKKCLKVDWREKLENKDYEKEKKNNLNLDWKEIYHLIILPMVNEPYEVVKETFEALRRTNYPLNKFIIALALEERAGEEPQETGRRIKDEYEKYFHKFTITTHPTGIQGEIIGKGSNEAWAARGAKKTMDDLSIPYEKILVSVFDVDTQVSAGYFSRLTYAFLTAKDPEYSSYQPIPLFLNNVYQAPALARVLAFSSSFWQMTQQSQPEHLVTFSSHSMPFKALVEIGFWDTDFVSEDSQIFWKLYLHYAGRWFVESLFYPISMDANVAPTFWGTVKNQYKQQRRWAWGSENIPYIIDGFFSKNPRYKGLQGNKVPFLKKIYWSAFLMEGHHSWATNALMMFALGWLPILLGGANFNTSLLAYNLPQITSWIMTLAMIGLISTVALGLALLPPKPKWFRPRHYLLYVIQWFLTPITVITFGAIPALEAQTRLMLGGKFRLGFWNTPKHRKEQ